MGGAGHGEGVYIRDMGRGNSRGGRGPPAGQRAVRALDVRVVLVHECAVEGLRTKSNAHTRRPLSGSAGGAGVAAGRRAWYGKRARRVWRG